MDTNVNVNGMPQQGGKGLAVASMVLGIVSLVLACCFPWVTVVLGLLAVILGGVSIAKKKGGKGMAVAGLVCGIIALVPAALVLAGVAATMGALGL